MTTDIFSRYGVEHVVATAEANVEWFFADAEEIGSSDVSCCVAAVIKDLGAQPEQVDPVTYRVLRNLVQNCIADLEESYA